MTIIEKQEKSKWSGGAVNIIVPGAIRLPLRDRLDPDSSMPKSIPWKDRSA